MVFTYFLSAALGLAERGGGNNMSVPAALAVCLISTHLGRMFMPWRYLISELFEEQLGQVPCLDALRAFGPRAHVHACMHFRRTLPPHACSLARCCFTPTTRPTFSTRRASTRSAPKCSTALPFWGC